MSAPRRVIPGTTYMITRRCIERLFLLRPDAYVTQTFLFCLAYAAAMHGVIVHAFDALSNHFHLVVTDPLGELPAFMAQLDGLVARSLNAYRGRWECFFAPGSYSAVALETAEDVMSRMVYVLTNPVEAGLVSHSKDWMGAISRKWEFGTTRTFTRPRGCFFDAEGALPETVELTLAAPPGLDEVPPEEADRILDERVIARETEIRAQFKAQGRWFLGMDAVMRVNPFSKPGTREPRRNLNPNIAAADTQTRVDAIEALREFRAAYRAARLEWEAGNRNVLFPWGTYQMRVRHGASVRPPPPS